MTEIVDFTEILIRNLIYILYLEINYGNLIQQVTLHRNKFTEKKLSNKVANKTKNIIPQFFVNNSSILPTVSFDISVSKTPEKIRRGGLKTKVWSINLSPQLVCLTKAQLLIGA